MAAPLEPREHDDPEKVAEMEGLGSRVESAVDPERRESRVGAGDPEMVAGEGLEQAPFVEDVDDVGAVAEGLGGDDVVLGGGEGGEEPAGLEGRRRSGGGIKWVCEGEVE
ncbi:hypothetical protein TorRG33x02_116860 [Trema orientale]|uniref:Uncharacterized protein n=1 Tax=Trema orientale TaxID=63057 RepID=A0A2P5F497_TREOI|nr:hypothetical protein TorRG33x02_116860 [Trema orientale]